MVNNNQRFKKTKIALAVVLTMGLTACGVDGDEGSVSNSVSTTQTEATQNVVAETTLTGTVTGAVFDTNGNPISGAAVFLGEQETVTNAGGIYVFHDVPVVNVAGVNSGTESDNEDNLEALLPVTIKVDGYLGGTVFVSPQAQVNNTGSESATTVQIFVDGFSADAGTAVLPALTATVYGRLNDCSTDTDLDGTGEGPAVGVKVSFEVTGFSDSASILTVDAPTVGSALVLAVEDTFSVMTDENGIFTAMLPADSVGNALLHGWHLAPEDDTDPLLSDFDTEYDSVETYLGIFEVCAVDTDTSEGNAVPMFSSIDGSVGEIDAGYVDDNGQDSDGVSGADNATYALLGDGIVNDFVINFSESLPNLSMDDTRVYVDGNVQSPEAYTAVLDATSASILLTFTTDLVAGDLVEITIAQFAAQDADGAEFVNNGSDSVHWDSAPVSTSATRLTDLASANALYASARFAIFEKATDLVTEATVELTGQVFDADPAEDGTSADLAGYSSVFADNLDDANTTVEQLNGQALTQNRLEALADAVESTNGGSVTPVTFDVNEAVITFENAVGDEVLAGTEELSGEGSFTVSDTSDGTKIKATAKNVFGDTMQTSSVTVTDAIAPTTVLQQSYGVTDGGAPKNGDLLVATLGSAAVAFGAGGETTGTKEGVSATVGNPIIYIQPRHLAARDAGTLLNAQRGTEFDTLTADMDDRKGDGETGTLVEHNLRPLYDETAMADWSAVSQNIGIAVSEHISVVEGATLDDNTAFITTALTAPVALNDIIESVDGGTVAVDLVQITIADVVALANNDHGGTISLEGVIQDTAGTPNVADADSNAQVVIEDAFPPMVVSARWNGSVMTVVFNENIEVPTAAAGTLAMQLFAPHNPTLSTFITLDVNAENFTFDDTTNTLVVDTDASVSAVWSGDDSSTQELYFYEDDGVVGDEQHAVLNIDSVPDTHGNTWAAYHNAGTSERWYVVAPQFLAVNELGQFTASVSYSGLEDTLASGNTFDDDGIVRVTVTFSHPLDLSDLGLDVNDDGIIQNSELQAIFAIELDGSTVVPFGDEAGNFDIDISADGKVVTIDLAEVADNAIIVGTTNINIVSAPSSLTTDIIGSSTTLN